MSFLDHLEELRRRILYSITAVGVAFLACWFYSDKFFDLIQQPIVTVLRNNHLPDKLVVVLGNLMMKLLS